MALGKKNERVQTSVLSEQAAWLQEGGKTTFGSKIKGCKQKIVSTV
jgi:hypothetical protein